VALNLTNLHPTALDTMETRVSDAVTKFEGYLANGRESLAAIADERARRAELDAAEGGE
jgi:hypothetical protein